MTFGDIAAASAWRIALLMFVLWIVSVAIRDASIVDIFWGIGFVVVALSNARAGGYAPRKLLVEALVTVWGLRLATHLYLRNRGHGEDPRYKAMRRRWGPRFPWVSLVTVYALQGALLWVVSLPVQVAMVSPTPRRITTLDVVGAVVCLVGLTFETAGDLQLTRFRSDPANAGKVMDSGLWRYTRHPNYFGDAVVWWGIGLISLATPGRPWAVIGPAVMTVLLLRVSGVALLERRMARTRPQYADYVARTSSFVPLPPRKGGS